MPKLNWLVVVVVLCITAALLYTGYNVWQQQVVHKPLREELAHMAGIISYQVRSSQQGDVLLVRLEPEAQFPLVARQVNSLMGAKVSEIIWEDNPNAHLLQVREQLDLALQEARWQREFVLLQQRIEEMVPTFAVQYQLGVDEEYIYLSLVDGSYTLHQAIPLLPVGGGAK